MGVAAPTLQHVVNHLPNGVPGLRAAVAVHQQPVVIAMLVANGRNNGGSQSFFLKRTPGRRPPHPATSAHSSVGRDSPCFIRWAAWKQLYDCLCHQRGEFAILLRIRPPVDRKNEPPASCRCSQQAIRDVSQEEPDQSGQEAYLERVLQQRVPDSQALASLRCVPRQRVTPHCSSARTTLRQRARVLE